MWQCLTNLAVLPTRSFGRNVLAESSNRTRHGDFRLFDLADMQDAVSPHDLTTL